MQVTSNQSVWDIAMLSTGTVESVFEIAAANGVGVTDTPVVGTDYIIPGNAANDLPTLQYLTNSKANIGTLPTNKEGGIGYMQIGVDFQVS